MSRSSELLKAAADYLDGGGDPFGLSFLSENDVASDECLDLADSLAMGARLVAWGMEHPREAAAFLSNGSAGMALDATTRALARIKLSQT